MTIVFLRNVDHASILLCTVYFIYVGDFLHNLANGK